MPKALSEQESFFPSKSFFCLLLSMLFLIGSGTSPDLSQSLISFFLMNFGYECVWLHQSSEFFRACPEQNAARFQFTLSTVAAFCMALCTLVYSLFLERWGIGIEMTLFVIGISFSAVLLMAYFQKPVPSKEDAV